MPNQAAGFLNQILNRFMKNYSKKNHESCFFEEIVTDIIATTFLFIKIPWPESSEGTFRSWSQLPPAHLPRVPHTVEASHCLFIAEYLARKLRDSYPREKKHKINYNIKVYYVEELNSDEMKLLHFSKEGKLEELQKIVKNKSPQDIDVNCANASDRTALISAIKNNHLNVIDFLLSDQVRKYRTVQYIKYLSVSANCILCNYIENS